MGCIVQSLLDPNHQPLIHPALSHIERRRQGWMTGATDSESCCSWADRIPGRELGDPLITDAAIRTLGLLARGPARSWAGSV